MVAVFHFKLKVDSRQNKYRVNIALAASKILLIISMKRRWSGICLYSNFKHKFEPFIEFETTWSDFIACDF